KGCQEEVHGVLARDALLSCRSGLCGRMAAARRLLRSRHMGSSHQVTSIPGDGIGPEVMEATIRAVAATGVKIDWERVEAGAGALARTGEHLPKEALDSVNRTRTALKGPLATPIGGGFPSANVALRKTFDLYANFRPVRLLPGVKSRFSDLPIDLV